MLQAFLVLPAFGLVYMLAAPAPLRRRIWQLALATAAMVAAAGWWVAIVALVPAGARPYIGGTQGNSVLELALGYNGLGRLNGDEVGGLGNTSDDAGWGRMFGHANGGQISWLLPAALILLVIGSWMLRGAARTDRVRASLGLWGGWVLVTGAVFSLMQGIFHQYYTVALAPAVAALVGLGAGLLWPRRRAVSGAAPLAAVAAVTAAWSYALLQRTPDWHPWLGPVVVVGGLVTAGMLLGAAYLPGWVVAGVAVLVSLAGPAAYAQDTVAAPRSGVIVTAGPAVASGAGLMRTGTGRGKQQGGGGESVPPGREIVLMHSSPPPSAELVALLNANADSYRWPAATLTSLNAAVYQLATRTPVMAIGGFNGTDPAPTLEQFQQYVAQEQIHYFVDGGGTISAGNGRPHGGSDAAQRIAEWVKTNYTARTVGTAKVYDLITP
ncbi:hypothetical protein [Nonomuraea salmonea]